MTSITITGFITYKGVSYVPGQVVNLLTADARALVNAGYAKYNTGGTADTTAPTAPTGVTATANSATSVTVTWVASTDATGVAGYQVLRNGAQIGSTGSGGLSYTDTAAAPATTYTYAVRAIDAAGNASPAGTAGAVTTPSGSGGGGDTTAPSAPTGVVATANSATSVTVSWSAATDAVGVTAYRVYRDGGQIGTTAGALTYTDTTALAGGTYVYSVRAMDAAGNVSVAGTATGVTTPGADTTAPTAPTAVTATANSATSAVVTWSASTDAVGVTGYRIFRGGVLVGTTTLVTSFVDAGLSPTTAYVFSVRAIDAAGNLSAAGTAASITTPAATSGTGTGTPDTTAPTAPGSVVATANSSTSVVVTWAASTDAVGVAGYQVLRGGVLIGSTNALSYTDAGLVASTAYVYSVKAYDAAGNVGTAGTAASVTTPATSTNVTAATLSGASTLGKTLMQAADATSARTAIGAIVSTGTPVRLSRTLPTDSWKDDSGVVADFTAIRAAKRPIYFYAPYGTGVGDPKYAGPVWGSAVDQANNTLRGDEHHETALPDYDPNSISGLAYYWNPNSLTAADGTFVASVPATVGGVSLDSTIALRQPVLASMGGRRVVNFLIGTAGTENDELVATLTSLAQPLTFFVVHDTTTTTQQQIVASGVELMYVTTPGLQAFAGTALSKTTGVALPDALGVTIVVVNGATTKIWRNGGAGTTGNAGANALGTTFRLGRHPTSGRPFNGNVGEVGIFSRALSTTEVDALGTGLASGYTAGSITSWATAS